MRRWRKTVEPRDGQARLLVPFSDRQLDPVVLEAALRIARAGDAVLVPAYLMVVPLEFSLDAPVQHDELGRALPILEAVELAARRAGVPVDARIERGRSAIDALQRLWEVETFDRILVPAAAPGHVGLSAKDVAWMLMHGPGEILVLRPTPDGSRNGAGSMPSRSRASAGAGSASPSG
jgi:nucleotide-binding universal stress UspA family protein